MHSPLLLVWRLGIVLLVLCSPPLGAQRPGQRPGAVSDPRAMLEQVRQILDVTPSLAEGGAVVRVQSPAGEPIPELDVILLPTRGWAAIPRAERKELLKKVGRDPFARQVALIEQVGQRFTTGQDGVVRVPATAVVKVIVLHPAVILEGVLQPGRGPLELTLEIPRRILVQVVDFLGRPVEGRSVELHTLGQQRNSSASTDSSGHAWLDVPEDVTDWSTLEVVDGGSQGRWGGPQGLRMMAGVQQPVQRPKVAVGTYAPGDPPLRLQLQPTGQVRFILYDADERPVDRLESLSLRVDRNGQWDYQSPDEQSKDSAMFERVPLGAKLVVTAEVEGLSGQLEVKAVGPTRPGEMTIIEGRLGAGPRVVRAVVVGLDGKPWANQNVGVGLIADQNYNVFDGRTNKDGLLEVVLPDSVTGEDWRNTILYIDAGDRRGGGAMGSLDISEWLSDQQVDEAVGLDAGTREIRLIEPPILVSGVVRNAAGQPLSGAEVYVNSSLLVGSGSQSSNGNDTFFAHRTKTDAEGKFEVRELDSKASSVSLAVSVEGYASDGALEAGRGQTGFAVELRRTGRFVAKLAGGPFRGNSLHAVLVRRGAAEGQSTSVYFHEGKANQDVPHGTYDLELSIDRHSHNDRDGEPLRIEGIEVPAGGEADDERLAPLDWSKKLRYAQILVRDAEQKPIANSGTVWRYITRENGGRRGSGQYTDDEGRTGFFCPLERCEISVQVPGYLHETVPADRDEIVFNLVLSPRLKVTMPADVKIPEGLTLAVAMAGPTQYQASVAISPGQTVAVPVSDLEKPQLVLQLDPRHQRHRNWFRVNELLKLPVEIEKGKDAELTLKIDEATAARLQNAAKALGLVNEDQDGGKR